MTKSLNVQDLMVSGNMMPVVKSNDIVKKTLEVMSTVKLGFCCVVGSKNKLLGVFTDGDLRRLLLKHQKPFSAILVDDINKYMTINPSTISLETPVNTAIEKMYKVQIWDLPVVAEGDQLVGVLHMHAALNPKLVSKN